MHHANDLAAAANADKPKNMFEEMVLEHYHLFHDLFAKENFDALPEQKPWDHAIELVPNAKSTLDCKVYPLNRNEQEQLNKFLDENLESGQICPSKSPFASPFFFIKKKDGMLRPVQDYCKLNEMTIKNQYPLPLISKLIEKLHGTKYFTKLDVHWEYNNIRIREGYEEKATFHMNQGPVWTGIMFFGLTNSPATFQWMMNDIFHNLIREGKVTIYLDDILIFSKDLNKHRWIVKCILQCLCENKLFLKAEKCKFEVLETKYLGIIISQDSIWMDPVKIAGIAEWLTLMKKKELQSFLGFMNFYWKFIKNYSKVVKALTQLTGNAAWTWGKVQDDAFGDLKKQIAEDVILTILNNDDPFRVEADASEGAVSVVLSQQQNRVWQTVAFMSKSLCHGKKLRNLRQGVACNHAHALRVVPLPHGDCQGCRNLDGSLKPPVFPTTAEAEPMTSPMGHWTHWIPLVLRHKPSALNKKADLLSRRDDHDQGKGDNNNIIVLQAAHFRALIMPTTDDIHWWIEEATQQEELWDAGITTSLAHDWGVSHKGGLLQYDRRIYIPRKASLRGEIIAQSHDHVLTRHPGIEETKELVLREYWWPKMEKDVKAYVKGCETCQWMKSSTQAKAVLLHPNVIPEGPWTHISVDMITGLPDSNGHDAMLMIVNRFCKAIILITCNIKLSAKGYAWLLRDHVYACHGMPQVVISNHAACSSSPSSWRNSTECLTSPWTHPPPFTRRWMGRPNESTRRSRSTFASLSTTNRLIGATGYLLQSSLTITEFIVPQERACSWFCMADTLKSSLILPGCHHSLTPLLPSLWRTWPMSIKKPRTPWRRLPKEWKPSTTKENALPATTKLATASGLIPWTFTYCDQRRSSTTNGSDPLKSLIRLEPLPTSSSSHLIGRSTRASMRSSWRRTYYWHSQTKNTHLHHHQIWSMMKKNWKLKKSSTLGHIQYMGERDRNHDESLTTSSSGKDGHRSIIHGSGMKKWATHKKWLKNTKNALKEDLNGSRDACLNKGVMLQIFHFPLSYLISAPRHYMRLPVLDRMTSPFPLRHTVTDR